MSGFEPTRWAGPLSAAVEDLEKILRGSRRHERHPCARSGIPGPGSDQVRARAHERGVSDPAKRAVSEQTMLLGIYLNDHLAGATGVLELARRSASSNRNSA